MFVPLGCLTINRLESRPLLSQRSLRTMLFLRGPYSLGNDVFVKFPLLRVLSLANSRIENIPEAVGNLRHLRLLDLGPIGISSLPESIRNLTNLQVLNLSRCESLHSLPKGITQFCNLRIIEVYGTNLSFVPSGMGRLERLNHFNGFVVGGEQGCSLEDLNSLLQLRVLEIYNLKEAVVAQNGRHVLGNKRHLKELVLICTKQKGEPPAEYSEGEIHRIQDVFEEVAPPPCLETLRVQGYFGHQFPSWMMSSSLGSLPPHLTKWSLFSCRNAVQLPPLGLLPELRHLTIEDAEAAVSFGSEVYESSSTPALFPNLLELTVNYCPRLNSLPGGLKGSPLKELYIDSCKSLERISHLPALRWLRIRGQCPLLKHVEKLDSLERLTLNWWEMDFLPEVLLRLRQLHQDDNFRLELRCNNDILLSKCVKESEYWPIIEKIHQGALSIRLIYHWGENGV